MPEKQPTNVRDFLPQTPDTITVITGEQGIIGDKSEVFFQDLLDYLGVTKLARKAGFAEINDFAGENSSVEGQVLWVMDMPVASALYLSNSFNYIVGAFNHYLTQSYEEKVRERLIPPSSGIIYIE